MEFRTIVFICVIAFVLIMLFLFPELRSLFKGFTKMFVKDMATTPEGAAAIYAEKIDEMQDKYNKADDALRKASGKLETEEEKLRILESKLTQVEKSCENLVVKGNMELASIKAEERSEIKSDIERSKKLIKAYSAAKADAMEVHKACEAELRKLKRESKEIVENMKVKEQLNDVYDSMDDLKNSTATDKLLTSIKEKNDDLNVSVAGARVVHESRTSTKIQRANEQAKRIENDEYLESLKKKYNKK